MPSILVTAVTLGGFLISKRISCYPLTVTHGNRMVEVVRFSHNYTGSGCCTRHTRGKCVDDRLLVIQSTKMGHWPRGNTTTLPS